MAKLLGLPKGIGMGPTRRSYNLLERGPIKSARQKFATNVAIAPQFSKATKLPPDKSQTSRSLDALLARTDEAGNAQYPALHLPACARSASGRIQERREAAVPVGARKPGCDTEDVELVA